MKMNLKIILGSLLVFLFAGITLSSSAKVLIREKNVSNDSSYINVNETISAIESLQSCTENSTSASVESKEPVSSSNTPDKSLTKEIVLQGKTIKANYQKSEKASGIQVHDRDRYVADDGSTLEYDQITGQLLHFSIVNPSPDSTEKSITEEQAIIIAQDYMKAHCDLSQYTFINCSYLQITGYNVNYAKMICGYESTDTISVSVTTDGKMRTFFYNPYVFDNISLPSKIDESIVREKLDTTVKTTFRQNLISYEVKGMRLAVNGSDQLVMEVSVSITSTQGSRPYTYGVVIPVLID